MAAAKISWGLASVKTSFTASTASGSFPSLSAVCYFKAHFTIECRNFQICAQCSVNKVNIDFVVNIHILANKKLMRNFFNIYEQIAIFATFSTRITTTRHL